MNKLLVARRRLLTINQNEKSEYLVNFSSPYSFEREKIRREDYGVPVELEFEGKKYKAPRGWDRILRQLYGNYMELPPENERHLYHNPRKIELGDWKNGA